MPKPPKQIAKIWLLISEISLTMATSSRDIRCTLMAIIKDILQVPDNYVTLDTTLNQASSSDIEEFFNSVQTNNQVYKASLSRQLSADLSPDVEETTFKDTAKSWFIKTADFGDKYDQLLQHPDGRFTQLLEDITLYHQIFQQGYDKIILIRPTTYTGYDIQLTAAMQCLGYTKEQFQFIIVQPIKLYAFHKPTQQLHPIPDIPTDELIKAIGMDALRWHCFSVPLTSVAPINISTAGQNTPEDSLYRVQSAYYGCCLVLQQAHQQGIIQLETRSASHWQITPEPLPLTEYVWDDSLAEKLASQLLATPDIIQQSATEIAPHLMIRHLDAISETCHCILDNFTITRQSCTLLLVTKQIIFEIMEEILSINIKTHLV